MLKYDTNERFFAISYLSLLKWTGLTEAAGLVKTSLIGRASALCSIKSLDSDTNLLALSEAAGLVKPSLTGRASVLRSISR